MLLIKRMDFPTDIVSRILNFSQEWKDHLTRLWWIKQYKNRVELLFINEIKNSSTLEKDKYGLISNFGTKRKNRFIWVTPLSEIFFQPCICEGCGEYGRYGNATQDISLKACCRCGVFDFDFDYDD